MAGEIPPIRPEIARFGLNPIGEIAQLAWETERDVIPLHFGETDLVTPAFIRDAAKRALDDGKTFYTYARGIPELRGALKTYLDQLYGVSLAPDRISVPGSSMLSVMMALQCLINTGDNIVIVSPIWPNIYLAAESAGAEVRFAPLKQDELGQWQLDLNEITSRCDARTKAVFVCSPNNPTGWIMPRPQQERLLTFLRDQNIALIADEVYGRLVMEGRTAPSFLNLVDGDEPVFVIGGFSKTWAMTGWRIGWMIAPSKLATPLSCLAGINNTGATVFAQYGALAVLTDPRGEALAEEMRNRCRNGYAIVTEMTEGHPRVKPLIVEGAFYAYLEIDQETDSHKLARRLVTEAGVGVAPGSAFGPSNDAFIRLCFAQDPNLLKEALQRLLSAL